VLRIDSSPAVFDGTAQGCGIGSNVRMVRLSFASPDWAIACTAVHPEVDDYLL
jgi:hypothetical protein